MMWFCSVAWISDWRAVKSCKYRARTAAGRPVCRMLCGLVLPDAGAILWNEKNIYDHRQDFFKEMSYIGHVNGIKMELTALENLTISGALAETNNSISLPDILEKMGLAEYENTPARKLSSGQ